MGREVHSVSKRGTVHSYGRQCRCVSGGELGTVIQSTVCVNDLSYNIHLMMHPLFLELLWHRGTKCTREIVSFILIQ